MLRFTAIIASLAIALPAPAQIATAGLTREQITNRCRPQLQTMIQEYIDERPADGSEISAEAAKDKANWRANGINDPTVGELIDKMRTEFASQGEAALRKGIGELKGHLRGVAQGRGQGYEVAFALAATCVMEAALADIEERKPPTALAARPAAVPPLRPTSILAAHNPAGEASTCLELITRGDFASKGARSNMGAVFRNRCSYPVETIWCVGERCAARGYDNFATMPAGQDRGISYDAPKGAQMKVRWGACRNGFASRPDLKGTLLYACK